MWAVGGTVFEMWLGGLCEHNEALDPSIMVRYHLVEGKTQQAAAAASATSERTVRR